MNTNSQIKKLDVSCIIINYLKEEIEGLDIKAIELFRCKKNIGFSGGNMLGVYRASPCHYYVFINNDTLHISKITLSTLKDFMDPNSTIGISSPQMCDQDKNFHVTIDHFSCLGREILKRPFFERFFPKKYYQTPTKVHYVQGSYMCTRAEVFEKVGGFDSNLFLYYEESDLSRSFQKQLNLSTYLYPDLTYIHYKSASTPKNISIKIEQKTSLLYDTRKHFGFWQHKNLLNYFIIRYFFTSIVKPKYWKLFFVLMKGAPISLSLVQKQSISIC